MNSVLLTIASLVILVLCVLFAVPYFIDWNGYRTVFEEQASQLVGREVRVGGDVVLRLLPAPYLSFENVRIADSSGRFDTPLLRLDETTVWLSVPPLLQGRVEAREVALVRPRLRLAIDENGKGNWEGLGIGSTDAMQVEAGNVAFKSVQIEDGRITLLAPSNASIIDATKLNGELSATSLNGPFRFRGKSIRDEKVQLLRLTTGRFDAEGGLKFHASLKPEKVVRSSVAFDFNGELVPRDNRWRIEGGLTGRVPLLAAQSQKAEAGTLQRTGELKATVEADSRGIDMAQIALTFESGGRPQLLTGAARLGWSDRLSFSSQFKSRWLDIDRLLSEDAGTTDTAIGAAALDGLKELAKNLARVVNVDGTAGLDLSVEKLNLGGDLVDGFALKVERSGYERALHIKELSAGLPGASRINLTGNLVTQSDDSLAYTGRLDMRGASLSRVLSWVAPNARTMLGNAENHFALEGVLALDERQVLLKDVDGELGNNPFHGSFAQTFGERQSMQLRLESERLDFRSLASADVGLSGLAVELGLLADENSDPAAGLPLAERVGDRDARIDVSVGELLLASRTIHDASIKLDLKGDRLKVDEFVFSSSDGIELSLGGTIKNVRKEPEGEIRYLASATTPTALTAFIGSHEDVLATGAHERILATLSPLRVAGIVGFGERGAGTLDMTLDGAAGPSRLVALLRSDAAGGSFAGGQLDVTMTLQNDDERQLLQQLAAPSLAAAIAGDWAAVVEPQDGPRPATNFVSLRATGKLREAMTMVAGIESRRLKAGFGGTVLLTDDDLVFDGDVDASAADPKIAMAVLGVDLGQLQITGAANANARIRAGRTALHVDDIRIRTPDVSVDGKGRLAFAEDGTAIGGAVRFNRAHVGALLTRIVAQEEGAQPALAAADALVEGVSENVSESTAERRGGVGWLPDQAFDFSIFRGLRGKVDVFADRLDIKSDMRVTDARMTLGVNPDELRLEAFEAEVLEGKVKARGSVRKVPAGAEVALELQAENVNLAHLVPRAESGAPIASGRASMAASINGRGLSPRGVGAVLEGDGTLAFSNGSFLGASPEAVVEESYAVVEENVELADGQLRDRLAARLAGRSFHYRKMTVPFTVRDGSARAGGIRVASLNTGSVLDVDAYVDLSRFAFDGSFTLKPSQDEPSAGKPLPPVTLVYAGRLERLGLVAPRIDAGALARELTVRQMEENVERLERLRQRSGDAGDVETQEAGDQIKRSQLNLDNIEVGGADETALARTNASGSRVRKTMVHAADREKSAALDAQAGSTHLPSSGSGVDVDGQAATSESTSLVADPAGAVPPKLPKRSAVSTLWQPAPAALPRDGRSDQYGAIVVPRPYSIAPDWQQAEETKSTVIRVPRGPAAVTLPSDPEQPRVTQRQTTAKQKRARKRRIHKKIRSQAFSASDR